jgi:hypothetical protein
LLFFHQTTLVLQLLPHSTQSIHLQSINKLCAEGPQCLFKLRSDLPWHSLQSEQGQGIYQGSSSGTGNSGACLYNIPTHTIQNGTSWKCRPRFQKLQCVGLTPVAEITSWKWPDKSRHASQCSNPVALSGSQSWVNLFVCSFWWFLSIPLPDWQTGSLLPMSTV